MVCQRLKNCEQISDGNSLREQILQNLLDLAKSKKLRHQFIHENRIALLEVIDKVLYILSGKQLCDMGTDHLGQMRRND